MKARILVVDDEPAFLASVQRALRMHGLSDVSVASDGASALAHAAREGVDVAFLDITMPTMNGLELLEQLLEISPATACIMVTARDDIALVMRATRLGAVDYLVKPLVPDQIVSALSRALERRQIVDLLALRRDDLVERKLEAPEAFAAFVTCEARVLHLLHEAELHARSAIPVLVTGETGTGKELLARALHLASERRRGPFVPINMLSLSSSLFEAEFFGYKRGAFTGAVGDKEGYLHQAEGGTLFLDEIGDLPLPLQGKLLRILQEGEFTPVGGTQSRPANVRFIAATHQDLDALVASGAFRRDLLYRLRFAHLAIPPLRRRRDDLLLLAARFLAGSSRPEARLSEQASAALVAHDWPGNVRELKGVIEAAANLAESGEVLPRHLNIPLRRRGSAADEDATSMPTLAEVERLHVLAVHRATGGNKTQTARILGISLPTLQRKLRAFGTE